MVGDRTMIGDVNAAHRLHPNDEYGIGISAADAQTPVIEGRETGTAILTGNCIGGDGGRETAGDSSNPCRIHCVHRRGDIASQDTIDRAWRKIPAVTASDHLSDDPRAEHVRVYRTKLRPFLAERSAKPFNDDDISHRAYPVRNQE